MTKKDYILIERVIKYFNDSQKDGSYYNLTEGMAEALENTNPHFNRQKFLEACGIEENI